MCQSRGVYDSGGCPDVLTQYRATCLKDALNFALCTRRRPRGRALAPGTRVARELETFPLWLAFFAALNATGIALFLVGFNDLIELLKRYIRDIDWEALFVAMAVLLSLGGALLVGAMAFDRLISVAIGAAARRRADDCRCEERSASKGLQGRVVGMFLASHQGRSRLLAASGAFLGLLFVGTIVSSIAFGVAVFIGAIYLAFTQVCLDFAGSLSDVCVSLGLFDNDDVACDDVAPFCTEWAGIRVGLVLWGAAFLVISSYFATVGFTTAFWHLQYLSAQLDLDEQGDEDSGRGEEEGQERSVPAGDLRLGPDAA